MKLQVLLVGALAMAGVGAGISIERVLLSAQALRAGAPAERKVLYWWDPMMPAYKSDRPGKSPMGMDMVPVYEGEAPVAAGEPGMVVVSPAVLQNLGTRTVVVGRASLTPEIETFGTVGFDESRVSHVHVRSRGWVERLNTRVEGEAVGRGQVLFEFFAPELLSASYEFVRELQRNNPDGTENARRKLGALGVSERQIEEIRRTRQVPDRIQVFAPRAGVVTRLGVAEGMFVEPEMTLMSIAELDQAG